jgi:hypothetical protein
MGEKGEKMKEALIEKILEMAVKEESVNGCSSVGHPFKVGEAYFIRTVTYHFIGIVKEIVGKWLILKDASWVADSGRFHVALEKGELSEVEYMDKAFINMDTITDATPWNNKVAKDSK